VAARVDRTCGGAAGAPRPGAPRDARAVAAGAATRARECTCRRGLDPALGPLPTSVVAFAKLYGTRPHGGERARAERGAGPRAPPARARPGA
jgi:hypothetical protein